MQKIDTGYISYKLNYASYHLYIFYEKNINFYFKSKLADELSIELQKLMTLYRKKLLSYLKASKISL